MNRLLALSDLQNHGIAIDSGLPLIMQGESKVASWFPNKLKTRDKQTELLAEMFQSDEMLSSNFDSVMKVDELVGDETVGKQFKALMSKTGDILSANDAPNIAALELGGWDTHANQGAEKGRLANQLKALDSGLAALRASLGKNWDKTVILVASESDEQPLKMALKEPITAQEMRCLLLVVRLRAARFTPNGLGYQKMSYTNKET